MSDVFVRVALDHPLATLFDYRFDTPVPVAPDMLVKDILTRVTESSAPRVSVG